MRSRYHPAFAALLLALFTGWADAGASSAPPLPAYQVLLWNQLDPGTNTLSGNVDNGYGYSSWTATISPTQAPSMSSAYAGTQRNAPSGSAQCLGACLTYFVEITAPNTGNVLVDYRDSGSVYSSDYANAGAGVLISDAGGFLYGDGACIGGGSFTVGTCLESNAPGAIPSDPYSFSNNQQILLPTNTVIQVRVAALAMATFDGDQASAWIDPTFAIDPSNAQAASLALVYSPGMQPVGSVAEPGSLAMLVAGVSMLGGLARRRLPFRTYFPFKLMMQWL